MIKSRKILGIDVGGTKIAAALVDSRMRLSQVRVVPTSQTDLMGQLVDLAGKYRSFSAIGLAMPGRVLASGQINRLPNVPHWEPKNPRQILRKKFKVEVGVINDAKALALAEAVIGAGKKFQTVAGVAFGTGVGVGVVNRKQVYFGTNGLAGEMGQFEMLDGQTFEKHVQRFGSFENIGQARKFLRALLIFVVRSFDPEIIIFHGGRVQLPGAQTMLNRLLREIYRYKLKTKVAVSKLPHPSVIGAALWVLKKSQHDL